MSAPTREPAVEPTVEPAVAPAVVPRDPAYLASVLPFLRLAMKGWFRSEVRDIERVPAGGVLIASNHSGGMLAMDVPILAVALAEAFGADRDITVLAHDLLFLSGASDAFFRRAGFVPANRENAVRALKGGSATIVFPGGDHDVLRPTLRANVIDFAGRTGYVRTALEAGVPLVPVVSIGGQEAQFHVTRGEWLGTRLGLGRWRMPYFPIHVGFPFGVTGAFPPNLPLPTKIVTQVLEPIDLVAEFGPDPDVTEVDAEVRRRMQAALDDLARQRRFPVLG